MTNSSPARDVTPVVLTLNEERNIERLLRSLAWADQVVVVDSGSSDSTERIAGRFPNVRWFVRPFDTHRAQWEFAIRATGIATTYALALDADYDVPPAFVDELAARFVGGGYAGGVAGFEYRVQGRALFGSVYPPKLVLFRPGDVRVSQPGHTQEFQADGPIYRFSARLVHDDRKTVDRFVCSQIEYARLEEARLAGGDARRWQDRVRRLGIMPLIAGMGAYVKAGGPLRGTASLRYAYERVLFECLLALRLFSRASRAGEADAAEDEPSRNDDVRALVSK